MNPDKRFSSSKEVSETRLFNVFALVPARKRLISSVTMFYPITHVTLSANMNCNNPCTYCITLCQLVVL